MDSYSVSDYLIFRGDVPLKNDAFADTDALVLCQIGYVHFDGIIDKATYNMNKLDFNTRYAFSDLKDKIILSEKRYEYMDVGLMNKRIPELFLQAGNTERFKDIELCGFICKNEDHSENPEQFAAMTFFLDEETICIVFRGTDDSIRGWKEDCNLATMDTIPSQLDALEYLKKVLDYFSNKKIIVAGHSKGGNIAMYACGFLSESLQNRISLIYNFDGPGFSSETLQKHSMLRIKDKLHIWYPQQSMVGMLFYHYPEHFKVAKSSSALILQHDLSTWLICGKYPAQAEELSGFSTYLNKTFNEWYENLPNDEKRKQFINSLFSILECSNKETLSAMIGDVQTEVYNTADVVKSKNISLVQKTFTAAKNLTKILTKGGKNTIKSVTCIAKGTFDVIKDPEQRQILKEIGVQLLKANITSAKDIARERKIEKKELKKKQKNGFKKSVKTNLNDAKNIGLNFIGIKFKK
ncbi:MAG: DUF2974 domain-containing protein [Treponema sp.]|nr:DUF2974 domain-containing protein [Treponema sp.]